MTKMTRGQKVFREKNEYSHPVTKSEACLGIGRIGGEGIIFGGPAAGFLYNNGGGWREEIRMGGGYSQHRGRAREVDGRGGGRKLERGDRQVCK
jgi:hypothetical protein